MYQKGCCCWKDLLLPATALGIFSMTVSFVQLFVQVAVWGGTIDPNTKELLAKSYMDLPFVLYFALAAMDIFNISMSAIFLVQLTRGFKGRKFVRFYMIRLIIYILLESLINSYFFVDTFMRWGQSKPAFVTTNQIAYLIVPLVYWITKVVIMALFITVLYEHIKRLNSKEGDVDPLFGYDRRPPRPVSQEDPRAPAMRYPGGYPSYQNPKVRQPEPMRDIPRKPYEDPYRNRQWMWQSAYN